MLLYEGGKYCVLRCVRVVPATTPSPSDLRDRVIATVEKSVSSGAQANAHSHRVGLIRTVPLSIISTLSRCISLAFMHILFFAVMAMFLFPKSDVCDTLANLLGLRDSTPFRSDLIATIAPTSPISTTQSSNSWCSTQRRTIPIL